LENVPVNSLKAFFGHTLGAAGVVETIISMQALKEGIVLPTLNFTEHEQLIIDDEQHTVNISKEIQKTDKPYFIKMLSGFGGCNAALLFSTCDMRHAICDNQNSDNHTPHIAHRTSHIAHPYIKKHVNLRFQNPAEITALYRSLQLDYPKFFKMDGLSKLGFLASEIIFKDEKNRFQPNENTAVICFNRSSSLDIDTQYQATIAHNDNYFPSPSLFVYTLPNIVTGEIAIRNKFLGETFFYICKEFDARQIVGAVRNAFCNKTTSDVLVAWIEHFEERREVMMMLVKNEKGETEFTEEQLKILYN
jgi:3-oxoacyl-[acyl-carrier-protein] synthase-1